MANVYGERKQTFREEEIVWIKGVASKKAVHDLNIEDSACSVKENKPYLVLFGEEI